MVSALEALRSESLPRSYSAEESQAEGVATGSTATSPPEHTADEKELSAGDVHRPRRERKALKRKNVLLSEDLIRFMQRDNRRRSQLSDQDVPVGIPSLPLVTRYTSASTLQPRTITISDDENNSVPSKASGSSKVSRSLKVGKKKRKLGYMLDIRASLPDLPPRHTWKRASVSQPSLHHGGDDEILTSCPVPVRTPIINECLIHTRTARSLQTFLFSTRLSFIHP